MQLTLQKILYSFTVVLLWNTCACCNWRQHLPRLSPHGLHWPTVDEGLDTAALTSVSLMLLGRRNATTGGSGNNLASISLFSISFQWRTMPEIFSKEGWYVKTMRTHLLIFFSLYYRLFLLISLEFEYPLSITLSLYPHVFKWWCKSPSLCLVVSTVEHIHFILMAWLNGILLKQCLGLQLLGERYWCLSVGLEYSCHVAFLDRGGSIKEGYFGFRHFMCVDIP